MGEHFDQKSFWTADAIELSGSARALTLRNLPAWCRRVFYLVGALLLAGLVWAATSKIDQVVTGRGQLTSRQPNMVVQPFETGIIRKILVEPGAVVRNGQPLIALDATFVSSSEGELQYKREALDAEIDRLRSELLGQQGQAQASEAGDLQRLIARQRSLEARARLSGFDALGNRLHEQRAGTRVQQTLLESKLKAARELERMQEELSEKGFGTRAALIQARMDRVSLEQQIATARMSESEGGSQLQQVASDRELYLQERRGDVARKLAEAVKERDAVVKQLTFVQKRRELIVLRAPGDGVVLELAKHSVGSVVEAAETLVTLVPRNGIIEAEVEIDPAMVGLVRQNQTVRLKLSSLPFQRYGTIGGTIRVISSDAIKADPTHKPVFKARVQVQQNRLRNLPPGFKLTPGMDLEADVRVGKRTVLSYLVEPITTLASEALREPGL